MNRRTFEILAKWIGDENKCKIVYEDIPGPCATLKDRTIHLPNNIKDDTAFSALAQVAHEAGHIKHSTVIPEDLVDTQISHNILNAIEDVRVDRANFNILPNIKDFYKELVDNHVYKRLKDDDFKSAPLINRSLINAILKCEGFRDIESQDKEVEKMERNHDITQLVNDATYDIDNHNWKRVVGKIEEIKRIFGIKKDPPLPKGTPMIGIGDANGSGNQGSAQGGGGGNQQGGAGQQPGSGNNPADVGNASGMIYASDTWGKGTYLKGGSFTEIGPAALQEVTKKAFSDLLSFKETRTVYEGSQLNMDNITDFFAGTIDDLFCDTEVKKTRKSKIIFLVDASGSMDSPLLDRVNRKNAVVQCIKAFIGILEDIRAMEGVGVEYEVHAFTDRFHELDQSNWERQYQTHSGGTNVVESFESTQKKLLTDSTIDGKKMIIVMTDGCVSDGEIIEVKKLILSHNEDVRCMFIGIGSPLTGSAVIEIIGDNNILASTMADQVIMDTVTTMLE